MILIFCLLLACVLRYFIVAIVTTVMGKSSSTIYTLNISLTDYFTSTRRILKEHRTEDWSAESESFSSPNNSASLDPNHTNAFSFGNAHFLTSFRLSSTLKRSKTLIKTDNFENGFKSGVFENASF